MKSARSVVPAITLVVGGLAILPAARPDRLPTEVLVADVMSRTTATLGLAPRSLIDPDNKTVGRGAATNRVRLGVSTLTMPQ
jgi:hypothetical protein